MPFRAHALAIAAVLCASTGCGPLHRGGSGAAAVRFVNQSLDQADVYAVASSGSEVRIGTVMAGRTETLALSPAALGGGNTVNIVARILARSRTPRTGPITLARGDTVEVTLPTDENTLTVLPSRAP